MAPGECGAKSLNMNAHDLDLSDVDDELERLKKRKRKLERVLELRAEVSVMELKVITSGDMCESMQAVTDMVANEFGVSVRDLRSTSRREVYVVPRHVAFYLLREELKGKLNEIGRLFDRDHGSVLHGANRVQDRIDVDPRFAVRIEELRQRCRVKATEAAA
jgi:chromosomal replication initiation ATPase DnaA